MTKRLFKIVWPALAVATLAMSSLSAEAADIRCRVPFDFTLKGKALSAGTYTISDERGVLTVQGQKSGAMALATRLESTRDSQPRLVFEKYGDAYVLRQVWTGTSGRQVAPSRHDTELARAAARNGQVAAAERIVISAM